MQGVLLHVQLSHAYAFGHLPARSTLLWTRSFLAVCSQSSLSQIKMVMCNFSVGKQEQSNMHACIQSSRSHIRNKLLLPKQLLRAGTNNKLDFGACAPLSCLSPPFDPPDQLIHLPRQGSRGRCDKNARSLVWRRKKNQPASTWHHRPPAGNHLRSAASSLPRLYPHPG